MASSTLTFGGVTYTLVRSGTSGLYLSDRSTKADRDELKVESPSPDTRHGLNSRKKFAAKFSMSVPLNSCESTCSGIHAALIGSVNFSVPVASTSADFENLRKVVEGFVTDKTYLDWLMIGGY